MLRAAYRGRVEWGSAEVSYCLCAAVAVVALWTDHRSKEYAQHRLISGARLIYGIQQRAVSLSIHTTTPTMRVYLPERRRNE